MNNPAPGFKKYPKHSVTTEPAKQHVRVLFKGDVIADSKDAVALHESMSSDHVVGPVVYYIPRKDVKMDRLVRSSHKTHCPFKGDASYFSIGDEKDAVWSYEQPYDELMPIRELLAFYPDKFSIEAR